MMVPWEISRVALQAATERESALAYGRVLGLTDADITEVVDAWIVWSSRRAYLFSWPDVRLALGYRSAGEEWHPERLAHLRMVAAASRFRADLEALSTDPGETAESVEELKRGILALAPRAEFLDGHGGLAR